MAKKLNKRQSRRRWHVRAVIAWGYSPSAALALCNAQGWFGDLIAAAPPSGRQRRGPTDAR